MKYVNEIITQNNIGTLKWVKTYRVRIHILVHDIFIKMFKQQTSNFINNAVSKYCFYCNNISH